MFHREWISENIIRIFLRRKRIKNFIIVSFRIMSVAFLIQIYILSRIRIVIDFNRDDIRLHIILADQLRYSDVVPNNSGVNIDVDINRISAV